jgi:hypothetical protein
MPKGQMPRLPKCCWSQTGFVVAAAAAVAAVVAAAVSELANPMHSDPSAFHPTQHSLEVAVFASVRIAEVVQRK